MMTKPPLDLKIAHHYFAANCFNATWEILEKKLRTADDDLEMELCSLASLWHWMQREDCEPSNLSIGCWQVARVYAAQKHPDNARRWAERALDVALRHDLEPLYVGYACEALAQAEAAAGDQLAMEAHLAAAREAAGQIKDADDKRQLLADLADVGVNPADAKTQIR